MEVLFEQVEVVLGGRTVLQAPLLRLQGAGTTALLGPNGAGKTTALRLAAGLERPARGRVLLDGAPAVQVARHHVAFAFQRPVFVRGSVRENLELALRLRGVPRSEHGRRIARAAELCGIGGLLERDSRRLSGGEAQRVNLARALVLEAGLVLLDEPMSGLDGPSREVLLADLPGILASSGATVVVVTHDRDEALLLATEVVVLLAGRVEAQGPAGAVFRRPPTRGVAAFLGYSLAGTAAIRPGALRVGPGERAFELEVLRTVDLGTHRAVEGRIAGTVVRAGLRGGEAAARPGERIVVSAPAEAVLTYGDDGRLVE